MKIPHWVAEVEVGLAIMSPAITVYRTSIRWVRAKLREGQADILMQCMKGCWPSPQSSAQIFKLAVTLHGAILPEKSMFGSATKTLLRRITRMVHPDKYQSAGPRLFYIALVSNTLIQRWMESVDNEDICTCTGKQGNVFFGRFLEVLGDIFNDNNYAAMNGADRQVNKIDN